MTEPIAVLPPLRQMPRGHGGRLVRRVFVLLALVLLGSALLQAPPASAHNVLVSSNPEQGSIQATAPSTVQLVFDQDVAAEYAHIAVTIAGAPPVPMTPKTNRNVVSADLESAVPQVPGDRPAVQEWVIGYRVVSADGHPITGALTFTVGTGPAAAALAQQSAATPTNPEPIIVVAVVATVLVAGAAAFLIRRRTNARRTHRLPE